MNAEARQAASTFTRHTHEAITGLDHGGKANGALTRRLPLLVESSGEVVREANDAALRARTTAEGAKNLLGSSGGAAAPTTIDRHSAALTGLSSQVKGSVDVLNLSYMKLMGTAP